MVGEFGQRAGFAGFERLWRPIRGAARGAGQPGAALRLAPGYALAHLRCAKQPPPFPPNELFAADLQFFPAREISRPACFGTQDDKQKALTRRLGFGVFSKLGHDPKNQESSDVRWLPLGGKWLRLFSNS